jgi:hypothetical protein
LCLFWARNLNLDVAFGTGPGNCKGRYHLYPFWDYATNYQYTGYLIYSLLVAMANSLLCVGMSVVSLVCGISSLQLLVHRFIFVSPTTLTARLFTRYITSGTCRIRDGCQCITHSNHNVYVHKGIALNCTHIRFFSLNSMYKYTRVSKRNLLSCGYVSMYFNA